MKPESESLRLFGITRSKGKMFEFQVPENQHIRIAEDDQPEALLLLAIGTLGDVAAQIAEEANAQEINRGELDFAASYFDALLASRLQREFAGDTTLLASAAYYLAERPGSSQVMAGNLAEYTPESPIENALRQILGAPQRQQSQTRGPHQRLARRVLKRAQRHVERGEDARLTREAATELREAAYASPSARDFLFADLILAVLRKKLQNSAWETLPVFSGLTAEDWKTAIRSRHFPKELWPAQLEIGRSGILQGRSGVIQMPTSAGKTRSLEMIMRSGLLAGRTRVAVIVAPFRALSHEIATSMREAFLADTNVRINELSDALQDDFVDQIGGLLSGGADQDDSLDVLVLTPEKLQFVIRQRSDLVEQMDLLIYDEAHQFDSGERGVTYELLLTEVRAGLPEHAQVVAISAVIQNANELSQWLLPAGGVVVDGSGLSPTARAVAFATWLEQRGQLQLSEAQNYASPDYFVPRVIEQQRLELRGRESNERVFPERTDKNVATDVALYLGLRVVPSGSVAIFAGTKSTANKIAKRVAEVFERGLSMPSPAQLSNRAELARLNALIDLHFGPDSSQSRAAQLGVFVHHRHTPNGLRLAIEHAMQHDLIRFVVCTSTLAQGVNLPIRYLILTGTQQGQREISVRDFQNLLGRAGRAGMHTEGLVIFADPRTYDYRESKSWRFDQSVHLLDSDNAEPTGSSILSLIRPFAPVPGTAPLEPIEIVELLFAEEEVRQGWSRDFPSLATDLQNRRNLLGAIESYLMANRRAVSFEEFRAEAASLCEETLAFASASEDEQVALRALFIRTAEAVNALVADIDLQNVYGRTLLRADRADLIYKWVEENRTDLVAAGSNTELLTLLWPLFKSTFGDSKVSLFDPPDAGHILAEAWISGLSYGEVFLMSKDKGFTKPHGKYARRALSEDDLIEYLNSTLAYDTALVVAAVCQYLGPDHAGEESPLGLFLKCLKYGLSTALEVSVYEVGFADRALAEILAERLSAAGYSNDDIREAIAGLHESGDTTTQTMPDYFATLADTLVQSSERES